MTLMTEKIGQGPTRRCDAKCYNAKHSNCDCICGGKNHAAGLKQATENVRQIFLPLIAESGYEIPEELFQDSLPIEPQPKYSGIGRLFA